MPLCLHISEKKSHLLRIPSLWNDDLMAHHQGAGGEGQDLLLLPVPVPYGFNIRTINPLQAAVPLAHFLAMLLAFTAVNRCSYKFLGVGYSSTRFFCLGWELADTG